MRSTSFRRGVRGMAVEVVCVCSLDCERHTELVELCQAQVACAELCQVAVPAGIHVQRVAPFCPLLLALPRTCCCKQAAGQAPAAAWCCRTMLALAWRSRRRRCSWHNCSCRSSLTRAHVRVCAGCKWRALIGYAAHVALIRFPFSPVSGYVGGLLRGLPYRPNVTTSGGD